MVSLWSGWFLIAFGALAAGSTLVGLRRAARTRARPSVAGETVEADVIPASGDLVPSYSSWTS